MVRHNAGEVCKVCNACQSSRRALESNVAQARAEIDGYVQELERLKRSTKEWNTPCDGCGRACGWSSGGDVFTDLVHECPNCYIKRVTASLEKRYAIREDVIRNGYVSRQLTRELEK